MQTRLIGLTAQPLPICSAERDLQIFCCNIGLGPLIKKPGAHLWGGNQSTSQAGFDHKL